MIYTQTYVYFYKGFMCVFCGTLVCIQNLHFVRMHTYAHTAFPLSIISLSRPLVPMVSMIYLGLCCFWEMQPR